MKTISIPESEYLSLKRTVEELKMQVNLLKDTNFLQKLSVAYSIWNNKKDTTPLVSNKRGSGKDAILYISDDFTAPLEDFKDYM